MKSVLTADFVKSADGRVFVVSRSPAGRVGGSAVLVVPPLGEEMNKCRKVLTDLGCALAESGHVLIVPDLTGTGDSEGEFQDASVAMWLRNLDAIVDWAGTRNISVDRIVGVRFGCLLAAKWLGGSKRCMTQTVFWQPLLSGEQIVRQWLRLHVGAAMFDSGDKVTTTDLLRRLEQGETLEVGGYLLTPSLVDELRSLELATLMGSHHGRVGIFEVGSGDISPDVKRLEQARDVEVSIRMPGEPFWLSTEIVRNPVLVERTVRWLTDAAT